MKRIITLTLAAILLAGAQTADQAQRMFKVARNTEVVDGNLESASNTARSNALRLRTNPTGSPQFL